jgi:uncharacterized DUF497 family protein
MFSKPIIWDEEKNKFLKRNRNIRFEQILEVLDAKGPLWIKDHPRPEIYPGQKLMAVLIGEYVYIVPFLETDERIILKTIYPNRKATKAYRETSHKHE